MHVVESVSARYAGDKSDDYETEKDKQRLNHYAEQLREKGLNVIVEVGYRNRVQEIVRIVKANQADMLVMGAHRHRGFFDFLYGQTVDDVRHKLTIPILIVN